MNAASTNFWDPDSSAWFYRVSCTKETGTAPGHIIPHCVWQPAVLGLASIHQGVQKGLSLRQFYNLLAAPSVWTSECSEVVNRASSHHPTRWLFTHLLIRFISSLIGYLRQVIMFQERSLRLKGSLSYSEKSDDNRKDVVKTPI